MRAMLVGGDFRDGRQTTGYVNAVRHLAAELAKENEVTVIPFLPQRPQLGRDGRHEGAKVLSRRPDPGVMVSALLGWPQAYRRTRTYLRMYDDRDALRRYHAHLKYSLAYSFNRSFFQRKLQDVRPEVVHVHGINIQTLPFLDTLIENDIPFVTTSHGLYSRDPRSFADADGELEEDVLDALRAGGNIVTAVSAGVRDELIGHFHLDPKDVRLVHNGVVPFGHVTDDRMALRRKYGLSEDRKIILTVGTVGERKNQRAVLQALKTMSMEDRQRILFLVVGGGKVEDLRSEATAMGLDDCVEITGQISEEALKDMYALSDVFSLTSTSEGFALVVLEAMSAGLPVLTYADLEGIDEVRGTECMRIVPTREPRSLARAMVEAARMEWDRALISEGAKRWDWGNVCAEYVKIYGVAKTKALSRGGR